MSRTHLQLWTAAALAVWAGCAPRQPVAEPQAPGAPREEPRVEERVAPVVIGAILPETGSPEMKLYGDLIRQGIDIAFGEHERAGGREVELVVVDDAADPGRAGALVRQLESRGAVGIIGPLLSASLEAAARARSDGDLVIISPTSSEPVAAVRHTYTLNAPDTRGAEALGTYGAQRGFTRMAVLYPRTDEFRAQAEAFKAAAALAGARITAEVPYNPGTTTFAQPLQQLRSAAARAIFIPAPERDIRQLAPQLEYYGLSGVQVLGSEAWVSDEVLGMLQSRVIEGVIAATPLYRSSSSVAWEEFVGLYEAAYRRTLDNPYPALGYDAARLILANLPSGRVRPADVARALDRLDNFRGATGVLAARGGAISRQPFLVRVEGGRPVLAQPGG